MLRAGAHRQQVRLARQEQHLQKGRRERRLVGLAKDGDRVVVGVYVGGDEAHADVAMRGALDPARGEEVVGIALNQQG